MTQEFIAGIVGAPFGVKGFVKVKPLSGEMDHLLKLKSVRLRKDGKEQVIAVEEASPIPPVLAMRFSGCTSPEAAKAYSGAELLVDREGAAPLQPGEYYVEDLKGFTVLDNEGQPLGQLTNIIEGGGGDLAEIQLPSGELKLVPFRKEFFSSFDLEKRQVILENVWILE